jgi:hypothetical protein
MKILVTALFILLSSLAQAKVVRMAVITSEFDKNYSEYFLESDDRTNKLLTVRFVTTMPNGAIFEDVTLNAEQIIAEGAVLVERNGYEVVKLELENFDPLKGGTFKLNHLYNGITGSRQVKRFVLNLVGSEFLLFDNGKRTNRMYLEANDHRVFGVIGVRAIKSSFVQE